MKITIFAAVLAAACSSKSAPPPAPPGEGIELIDPGALPHRELRYHLTKGTAALLEMEMDLDFVMGQRGGAMPTVALQMEIRADDVRTDGSARIRTKVASAHTKDRANTVVSSDVMQAQAALLTGLELTATLSPRGAMTESKVASAGKDLPPALAGQLEQLNQSLEQVAMPLPAEAVGVGAKWRNRKVVLQNGVKMQTVSTIEVVAIDGDKVTVKSSSTVSGDDQKIEVEGMKASITKVGGSGNHRGVIDLGRMVMTGTVDADFHFTISNADRSDQMSMKVASRLKPLETIQAATDPAAPSEPTKAAPPANQPDEPLEQHETPKPADPPAARGPS